MPNPAFAHRDRMNLAASEGLANSLASHAHRIKSALQFGDERLLQLALADLMLDSIALADLMLDSKVIEQAIVDGGYQS